VNIRDFKVMLREMDPAEMAVHSIRDHHVEGIDYLCLHRSDKLTVKLYFIDPTAIDIEPGKFLVTPHTHRYNFESTVLKGTLRHVRFEEVRGTAYEVSTYSPETRSRESRGDANLVPSTEVYSAGGHYWNSVLDIHTLIVPAVPVLLGLVQYSDVWPRSTVYVRKGHEMKFPESSTMTADEAARLRERALSMLS
jgi:hypothetical protein